MATSVQRRGGRCPLLAIARITKNWRYVRVRMGVDRSRPPISLRSFSPRRLLFPPDFHLELRDKSSFFLSLSLSPFSKRRSCAAVFSNAVGLNWRRTGFAPRGYLVSTFRAATLYNSINHPVDARHTVDIWLFWRHAARRRWFSTRSSERERRRLPLDGGNPSACPLSGDHPAYRSTNARENTLK